MGSINDFFNNLNEQTDENKNNINHELNKKVLN